MCAIGYFLEDEGLLTTGISLVRENAEDLRPPRSLWVPFPLGRPLGKPSDSAFQHRVIAAALDLLQRPSGPVLEDFPEDAPGTVSESPPACPVSFPRAADSNADWTQRLAAEFALLKPWHDLGRRRRGRSIVGVSDTPIEGILDRLGALLDADEMQVPDLKWFKYAIEDAKSFYLEALTAQPGEHDHSQVQQILWAETQLGAALTVFYEWFSQHPKLALMARMVASRVAIGASTGVELEITASGTRILE